MTDLGGDRYSQVQPGSFLNQETRLPNGQVQPDTAEKNRPFEDIEYDTERSLVDHLGTT